MTSAFKKLLLSRNILTMTAILRNQYLVRFLRFLPSSGLKNRVVDLFDPNVIRKNTKITFKEKYITFRVGKGGTYFVDVNDHLGYRFYVNSKFDDTASRIGQIIDFQADDIFLDIGANIGSVSIPFALEFNNEVIAIEASPLNASILLKNVSLNHVKFQVKNICAVSSDLASREGYINIYTKSGNTAANSVYESWNPSRTNRQRFELSKTSTLDKVLTQEELSRIKLIKIDVEGAELEVLSGFTQIEDINAPIIFEYRVDIMIRDLADDGSELLKILRKNFELFGVHKTKSNEIKLVPFNEKVPAPDALGLPKKYLDFYLALFKISIPE